jgi:hypothetical protein
MFHSWQPLQGTLYGKAPARTSEVGKEDKLQCHPTALRRLCVYGAQSSAESRGRGGSQPLPLIALTPNTPNP